MKPNKSSPVEKLDKYYAFKHFSRYIRPGAIRLGCSPDDPFGLSVAAYRHETNGTMTIVAVNAGGSQSATIQLPSEPTGINSFQVFTSQSGSVWQESTASVSDNTVTVSVPGNGLVTLYGEGNPMVPVKMHRRSAAPVGGISPRVKLRLNRGRTGLFVTDGSVNGHLFDLEGRAVRQKVPVR